MTGTTWEPGDFNALNTEAARRVEFLQRAAHGTPGQQIRLANAAYAMLPGLAVVDVRIAPEHDLLHVVPVTSPTTERVMTLALAFRVFAECEGIVRTWSREVLLGYRAAHPELILSGAYLFGLRSAGHRLGEVEQKVADAVSEITGEGE